MDSKCYTLPQMSFLGFMAPQVVTASSLPVGSSQTFTLAVVWREAHNGLRIDISSFTGSTASSYYVSLQADSGPNAALRNMYAYSGVTQEIWRKVRDSHWTGRCRNVVHATAHLLPQAISIHRFPFTNSVLSNGRIAVLSSNSAWTLSDIGVVVRPESFAEDGSSAVVSLCRIGNGNSCGELRNQGGNPKW